MQWMPRGLAVIEGLHRAQPLQSESAMSHQRVRHLLLQIQNVSVATHGVFGVSRLAFNKMDAKSLELLQCPITIGDCLKLVFLRIINACAEFSDSTGRVCV
jgi:hypothetical protein